MDEKLETDRETRKRGLPLEWSVQEIPKDVEGVMSRNEERRGQTWTERVEGDKETHLLSASKKGWLTSERYTNNQQTKNKKNLIKKYFFISKKLIFLFKMIKKENKKEEKKMKKKTKKLKKLIDMT